MRLATVSILVVSNLSSLQKSLRSALDEHFDLVFVESIDGALEQLRAKLPDAIIIDHSLGVEETYAFIDRVRNKSITRNLPFVMISRESANAFVLRAVRAGVSHFIGIPFEPKMLVEKIYFALMAKSSPQHPTYFEVAAQIETEVTAFGRISYISKNEIHFETYLKLEPGFKIHLSSPLSDALQLPSLEVKIKSVGGDTYYNYPFAVDAEWIDESVQSRISDWIKAHFHLNSPKKSKVLIVHPHLAFQEGILSRINLSSYSVRSVKDLSEAASQLPFMNPKCLVTSAEDWNLATPPIQKNILKIIAEKKIKWIVFGHQKIQNLSPTPFYSPPSMSSVVMAIEKVEPPTAPDLERLYFSKSLEDSRVKIFISAKAVELGELGVRLALSHDLVVPSNYQLSLKIFSKQELRNPFVRAWPPVIKTSSKESEGGKYKVLVSTHFLGVNDQQGQAVRQWLRSEELKKTQEAIAPMPPTREGSKKKT